MALVTPDFSQQLRAMHIKQTHISTAYPNLLKEHVSPTHGLTEKIKHENTTMCIVHKGFRGFRTASLASFFCDNLIGLKPAIPYDTIHSTLYAILLLVEKQLSFSANVRTFVYSSE